MLFIHYICRASWLYMTYIRKFRQQNLESLFKLRERRHNQSNSTPKASFQLPRFVRPSSQSRLVHSKIVPLERIKTSSDKKLYNKLSNQLKEIKESIAILAERRKKKPSKYKQKVVTQVSKGEDPKSQIFRQVLKQIKEIKSNISQKQQVKKNGEREYVKERREYVKERPHEDEKTLFYGVDYIEGTEFKIKIKLSRQKYCMIAKNSRTKLILEMDTADYMDIHMKLLHGNPCKIFSYLIIRKNELKFSNTIGKSQTKSLKSYISHS